MQPSDSSFNKKDDSDASQRPVLVGEVHVVMRAESDDDRRTDEQAANKLQALRNKCSGTEDVARSALSVKNEAFHDANAQDEDKSTVKEEEEEVRSREKAIGRQIFEILSY